MRVGAFIGLVGLVVATTACASTSPQKPFEEVRRRVAERTGKDLRWSPAAGQEDRDAERAVDRLLAEELTVDRAVQVALLANQNLKVTLEELAIGQADLVQAGLLKNPVFTFGRTAWESEHIDPNLFGSVEFDFLDVVTMPLRKRVAKAEFEAVKLQVGDEVLALAAEVRAAFYAAQASSQVVAMRRMVEEAAKASAELAQRQAQAGNMNDLALNNELGLAAQASLETRRAEMEAVVHREALNKAMGVWGARTRWIMGSKLPELPAAEPPLERLESRAIAERLDVDAARRNAQATGYALSLAKTTRWTGTVNVAVEAGRLRHNQRFSFGPSVAIEIPLFDQRQAQIAKLESYQRRAESSLRALSVDVRADVRAARARLLAQRAIVEQYATVMVPIRERIVHASQQQYDAMLLGTYQLIMAKQNEFETYRQYIEALRDYWIARSDLERALGGRLEGRAERATSGGGR